MKSGFEAMNLINAIRGREIVKTCCVTLNEADISRFAKAPLCRLNMWLAQIYSCGFRAMLSDKLRCPAVPACEIKDRVIGLGVQQFNRLLNQTLLKMI